MSHLDLADYIVIGAFFVALVGLVVWVVTYAWSSRGDWRMTREGRHLMTFRSSLALFMAMGVVNNIWLSYPGRDIVRCTVVVVFAAAVVDGVRVLRLAQLEGRAQRLARQVATGVTPSAAKRSP